MFGHQHLEKLHKTLEYRINYVNEYFAKYPVLNTKELVQGLDLPEFFIFLKSLKKYVDTNVHLLRMANSNIDSVKDLFVIDIGKRYKEFQKHFDTLFNLVYELNDALKFSISIMSELLNRYYGADYLDVKTDFLKKVPIKKSDFQIMEFEAINTKLTKIRNIVEREFIEVNAFKSYLYNVEVQLVRAQKIIGSYQEALAELNLK
jgi:hypothetical protein